MAQQDPWAAFRVQQAPQPQAAPAAPAGGMVIAPMRNPRREQEQAVQQQQREFDRQMRLRADARAEEANARAAEAAARAAAKEAPAVGPLGRPLTKGQEAVDRTFAKTYTDFMANRSDVERSIADLDYAIRLLEQGDITGPVLGQLPNAALSVVNPRSVEAQEAVARVAQRNLKEVLGGQFARVEGEQLIARAFNPRQSEADNLRRVRDLRDQMAKSLQTRDSLMSYYGQFGTISGWKPDWQQTEAEGQGEAPAQKQQRDFTVNGFTPRSGDMDRIEFEAQLSELLRRGADAATITEWSKTTPHTISDQRMLNEAIEAYRGGYTGPVRSFEGSNATISPNSIGSFMRGVGDAATLGFMDEAMAAGRAVLDPNMTYEQAWQAEQADRALDNPGARSLGNLTGIAATAPLSIGAGLLRAPTLGGQMARGAGFGAGVNAVAGVGAAPMDDRLQTLGSDILVGGAVGAAAPLVVRGAVETGRLVRDLLPGGAQRQATEALSELQITPDVLRQRAAEFVQATGRAPRIADLLDPSEAARLQRNIAPSDEAVARAVGAAETETRNLPASVSGQVQRGGPIEGPEAAALRTRQQGDVDFGAIRDVEVPLGPNASLYLEQAVVPEAGLTPLGREQAMAAIERGSIPMGLLDTMRKNLRKRGSANPGQGYEDRAGELQQFMAEADPRAAEAIDRYARNATRSEAVELGQRAVRPQEGVNFPEQVSAMRYQGASTGRDVSGEITEGLSLGARSAAYRDALANPASAYRLIRQLDESPALAQDLRLALGDAEADRLIQFATVQRRAVDNLSAISGVPANQVASQLDDAKSVIDALVAGGRGAGGAMVSSMTQSIARRFGLGRGPANKLAEDLFNPNRFDAVVRAIEKRGKVKDRGRIEEILRDQLIRNIAQSDMEIRQTARESYRQQ